ncbi:nucleotidyl transferase AbiEii/AbiGii toxin family protein [Herbiconiux sp. CPCC 205763]|uniref:Nucleotidyl transferase AbiEii/AbiGii toxin family protein n=1 Tax=Herbiconiux aconitum TaxID=2970913 RepID=A0ABT2GU47_9MICO|nr:nucleotidyl transferase AbiEii/AbiGii toxin family protein [Herbiconiux aconitum]MCS5719735.1 nucleotidyl transferase AbiEii/AbiGii toxin family protein [Herbiconiux aconitum]
MSLTRDDLAAGLADLVAALAQSPEPVLLRLVGGAAISLVYDADRRSTVDIDGQLLPRAAVLDVATAVGARRGWGKDWINDAAAHFLPAGYGGREQEWVTVHDDGHVVIEVGSATMLLAMKLLAAQRRGMREFRDIAVLAAAAGVHSVDEAEEIFGEFYPGDAFTARTAAIVQDALDSGYQGRTTSFPVLG